jgi:catechol 2,3-dioxygenase-like lactoylglutathione lyase family enzyme
MMKGIEITGVEWVVFGVEDLGASRKFLDTYGLIETASTPSRSVWEALDGSGVELRPIADPTLPRPVVEGPTGRLYIWGVADEASLVAIKDELSKDRPCTEIDGLLTSTDDDGHAIAFRVSQRKPYDAEDCKVNVAGLPNRRGLNLRVSFKDAGRPRALGHIVFWSRDPERSFAFYRDRLGFRVTDSYKNNGGIFARAKGHGDHHSIFFLQIGELPIKPSLQHMEFQFGDVQEVMVVGHRLHGAGFQTAFGPGRHELGSNWYWYFHSPLGTAFEVSADMDRADDNWQPGVSESLEAAKGWALALAAPNPAV